jgi:predicted CopG family antitoxin
MSEIKWTTIAIRSEVRDVLDSLKVHPRQSYSEIIVDLVSKSGRL